MDNSEIFAYFDNRRELIVRAITEIADIESPSRDFAQSAALADWIARRAEKIGIEIKIEKITAEGFGVHLILRAFGGSEKPVLLLGHTDTVHPIGTGKINPTRIDGGKKLYGCGVFDMKANVVLMLEVLRFFADTKTQPARPVTILLTCDEEIGSPTGRDIVEREAANSEYCLVCEPSAAGRVKTGRKGTGNYTLRAKGRAAHAGLEPEKGASAVLEIARQIAALADLATPSLGTTVNVCTVKGGTAANVIPDAAECTIDARFSTMAEARRIDTAIRSLRAVDGRVSLEVAGGINRPPMQRTEAVAALYERARECAASFGCDLGETQVGGASDGNFVAALGIAVLDGLGVTGDGAHTLDEYIYIDDLAARAALITDFLVRTICASPRPLPTEPTALLSEPAA